MVGRYAVSVRGDTFVVTDATTKQEVFVGGKTEVEDWLDWQENCQRQQLRLLKRQERKRRRRGWFNLFAA